MVLEQRRREQNGKRTTQAVAGQPDLLRHALAASRGADEPPTNAAPMSYRCRGEGRIRNVLPPRHPRPMHDERYKTIFAFPRMVEDLLRGFAARDWAGELDFSTLRKVPAEYVSDTRLSRRGDAVWQLRFGDGRHLLVMLEFQSTDDPRMALRILAYTGLLYQELARNNAPVLNEHARLPAVLPVVLYRCRGRRCRRWEHCSSRCAERWRRIGRRSAIIYLTSGMSGETICRDPTWSRSWSGWSRAARSGISSR